MGGGGRTGGWPEPPSQTGRRFVVTGANGGVGLETARALLHLGAEVVLACRSAERAEEAAAGLRADPACRGTAAVGVVDVADLDSVRTFAADPVTARVDVLVNNAGVMGLPEGRSPQGHELHLATNHLGHFALTNLLLPRLTDRVVVVGSVAHRGGALDVDDLDWHRRGYRPFAAYRASKQANLLFLGELQRRLTAAGSTLRATGAHPGSTATGITGHTGRGWMTSVGSWGHRLVGMTTAEGARSSVLAATLDLPGNSYLGPRGVREMRGRPEPAPRSVGATDPLLARALWERSEELSGVTFPLSPLRP